ncbi:MAG TPA: GGDEF domain-containing protein [Patescibacteria group bacterium]|nr:GGDEF domain-containing protein [Patescibacteria group bacterium]
MAQDDKRESIQVTSTDREKAALYNVQLLQEEHLDRFVAAWKVLSEKPYLKERVPEEKRLDILFISEIFQQFTRRRADFMRSTELLSQRDQLKQKDYVDDIQHSDRRLDEKTLDDVSFYSETLLIDAVEAAKERILEMERTGRDELTGLWNRRQYERYIEWVKQTGKELGYEGAYVIFLDIDHFKSVNDTYGHEYGDILLKRFGSLQRMVRTTDTVFRYGGEEFIMILPTVKGPMTDEQREQFVDRVLRNLAEQLDFPLDGGELLKKTFSAGAVYFDFSDQTPIEDAVKKADDLLYASKKTGRNKVSFEDGYAASLRRDVPAEPAETP